jgi:hypothetical protein
MINGGEARVRSGGLDRGWLERCCWGPELIMECRGGGGEDNESV